MFVKKTNLLPITDNMSEEIKHKLQRFFPSEIFTDSSVTEDLENGDILNTQEDILLYLQTALLDDKPLEVELDGASIVYFSRLKDDPPELEEGDGDEHTMEEGREGEEETFKEGSYLQEKSHLITLPMEPGIGNLHLRRSGIITLRMFTKSYAVEFGTTFLELTKVEDLPVLKLEYPKIARIVRNAREFRAKVPDSLDFYATIDVDDDSEINVNAIDISIQGMAFSFKKNEQKYFQLDDTITLKLYLEDELLARLDGSIKHRSKIRKRQGIDYICGVLFDLESRISAAVVESIVATVQRAHLRELAEKSETSGFNLIA